MRFKTLEVCSMFGEVGLHCHWRETPSRHYRWRPYSFRGKTGYVQTLPGRAGLLARKSNSGLRRREGKECINRNVSFEEKPRNAQLDKA